MHHTRITLLTRPLADLAFASQRFQQHSGHVIVGRWDSMFLPQANNDTIPRVDLHASARQTIGVNRIDRIRRVLAVEFEYVIDCTLLQARAFSACDRDALRSKPARNARDCLVAKYSFRLEE
jgi:hypothetical protein